MPLPTLSEHRPIQVLAPPSETHTTSEKLKIEAVLTGGCKQMAKCAFFGNSRDFLFVHRIITHVSQSESEMTKQSHPNSHQWKAPQSRAVQRKLQI